MLIPCLFGLGDNLSSKVQSSATPTEWQLNAQKELREENIIYSRGPRARINRELQREDDISVYPVIADSSAVPPTPGWQTREVTAGSDLDQDGFKEILITDYQVKGVHIYEVVGDNTLEWVATLSDPFNSYNTTPRHIITGDLDGNGREEIIYVQFREPADEFTGVNVWEWDGVVGSDNYTRYVMPVMIDGFEVDRYYGENCLNIGDVDQDGQIELLLANNGSDHVYDICLITHVEGTFDSGLFSLTHEYYISQNDDIFGGSPGYGQPNIADLDGDGQLEAIFTVWDHAATLFIEATGPDEYELQSLFNLDSSYTDQTVYGSTYVTDINNDGHDEIYGGLYPEGWLWQVKGGDDVSEMGYGYNSVKILANTGATWDVTGGDVDGDGVDEIFSVDYDNAIIYKNYYNGLHWRQTIVHEWIDIMGGFSLDFAGDLDGDGQPELVQGFLEPPFSEGNPLGYTFAVIEWNDFPPAGDVNGDYEVDINDLISLVDFILLIESPDENQFVRSDLTHDGELDILDAVCLVELLFEE